MILKKYKLAFTSPKYTICCVKNIKISDISRLRGIEFFSNEKIYLNSKGNVFEEKNSFEFYTVIIAGSNSYNLAKKYFLTIMKNASKFSELHQNRYFKYIEDFNLKGSENV